MSDYRDLPATVRPAGVGLKRADNTLDALIHPRSMAEIALNCAGFFVGLLIMTGDYVVVGRSLNQQSWEFLASPKALVWIILVAGQFAFWATIVEPLWSAQSRLKCDYGLRLTREIRLKSAAAIIFFALPGFFLVRIVPDSNLAHHDLKMAIVNCTAMIVSLVAVAGIWYVRAALEARFAGTGSGERPVHSIQEGLKVVIDLRGDLQWFITLLGAMVALATLAKGALRQAFLATGGNPAEFPSEFVLLQGAYFTGLMALVYIPTYTILAAVGADLVESAYPVTAPDLDWENLSRWQGNRKSLEEILQLRSGAVDNLRASVSILAPVTTSVVTVLLGTK
jgi:hypothetical protein